VSRASQTPLFGDAPLHGDERPQFPMLILPLPAPPETFDNLEGLAARVQELRGDRGLQGRRQVATYHGFGTFEAISLYVTELEGDTVTWLGTVAIQGRPIEALQAAVRREADRRRAEIAQVAA
jgi:hypothetical protein